MTRKSPVGAIVGAGGLVLLLVAAARPTSADEVGLLALEPASVLLQRPVHYPVAVAIALRNTADHDLTVVRPSMIDNSSLRVSLISYPGGWNPSARRFVDPILLVDRPDVVTIPAGQAWTSQVRLDASFAGGLSAGIFEFRVAYTCTGAEGWPLSPEIAGTLTESPVIKVTIQEPAEESAAEALKLYLNMRAPKPGDLAAAVEAQRTLASTIVDRYYNSPYCALARLWLGHQALREGRFEDALEHVERIREEHPEFPLSDSVDWLAIKALIALGRHADAIPLLERVQTHRFSAEDRLREIREHQATEPAEGE